MTEADRPIRSAGEGSERRPLAPGSVLQLMYIKRRLASLAGKRFIELGAGNGQLSRLLLDLGLSGVGYDLNASACENNARLNRDAIAAGHYRVENADFFQDCSPERADLIISSMVLEHLAPDQVDAYFAQCRRVQGPGGMVVTLVPASSAHWSIEDEIAGHHKRYSSSCFDDIARTHQLSIAHIAGLTYPLSNWLLPLSNFLVRRRERSKLELSMQDRTVLSGNRDVPWKTVFPRFVGYLVNEITLYPFYLLQRVFRHHSSAMVLYCELVQPADPAELDDRQRDRGSP
jgi:SAM-dependent methyltransferase